MNLIKILLISMGLVWVGCPELEAKRMFHEREYQEAWAAERQARTEVVMSNGTRCDIIYSRWAIEVDFADKWAEAIGQCLHYSALTGKKPGVLLIMENEGDDRYLERLVLTSKAKRLGWVSGGFLGKAETVEN